MNCTAFTYYVTLMPNARVLLLCTDSSHQDGLMLRLLCMFLGCDMPMQLVQLVLLSEYDDYDRL